MRDNNFNKMFSPVQVHCLPVVEFSDRTLMSEKEWWRAYVLLTIISQAYIWAEGEEGLTEKVPKVLAVPWMTVAEHVGLPPVVTYAAVVLHNWRLRGRHQSRSMGNTNNLAAIHTFTGTEDESWFYMVSISVELAAVPGIKAVVGAFSDMATHDDQKLTEKFGIITGALEQMKLAMNRMYDHCNPEVFYVKIRPFEAGTKGLDAFPNGLVYEGVSSTPKEFSGASAAQSSAIPTIDIFLGANHTGEDAKFLAEMRDHMPPKHRRFLEELGKQPAVREYTKQSQNRELIQAYNKAVEAFETFRSEHVQMVFRYIVSQKSKSVNASLEDRGTGGTPLMLFLKKVRDDTKALMIEL